MKHLYAYSDLGLVVSVDMAHKNQMNQKFYYDENKTCELILRDGDINTKHFAFKKDAALVINGHKIPANDINEREAHFNFKMRVKKNEYILFDNYQIRLKNIRLEFNQSNFRFDLKAELLCGTPCVIEIIRTSKTSTNKENYLRKNQILTFEIFIDKDGNQNYGEFNLYGNQQIESIIRERIANGIRIKELENGLYYRKEKERRSIDGEIDERISDINGRMAQFKSENERIRHEYISKQSAFKQAQSNGTSKYWEIIEAIRLCREIKRKIENCRILYKSENERIKHLESEIQRINEKFNRTIGEIGRIEREFESLAKRCKIEWFRPKFMTGEANLEIFKYWTT